jgi:hypothetical protein
LGGMVFPMLEVIDIFSLSSCGHGWTTETHKELALGITAVKTRL